MNYANLTVPIGPQDSVTAVRSHHMRLALCSELIKWYSHRDHVWMHMHVQQGVSRVGQILQ